MNSINIIYFYFTSIFSLLAKLFALYFKSDSQKIPLTRSFNLNNHYLDLSFFGKFYCQLTLSLLVAERSFRAKPKEDLYFQKDLELVETCIK